MQIYLPDDLYGLVKARGLPASELLQKAVRAEVRRLDLLAETGARRGSAVDALVVAFAEPDGTVLTGDPDDLAALAQFAERVREERI